MLKCGVSATILFSLVLPRELGLIKDVQLMLDTAGDRPLAVLPLVAKRMDQLIAAGHGAKDSSVLGIDAVQPH